MRCYKKHKGIERNLLSKLLAVWLGKKIYLNESRLFRRVKKDVILFGQVCELDGEERDAGMRPGEVIRNAATRRPPRCVRSANRPSWH